MAVQIIKEGYPVGRQVATTLSSCGTVNSAVSSYVSVSHKQLAKEIYTTITLTNLPQTVVNGTEYQGTLLWTMPAGLIKFFNANISLAQKTTSDPTTTINASVTGAVSVGSATASNVALTGTMADIIPSTAFTSSATQNVAGATVTATLDANDDLSEEFNLDGQSTAVGVYLNSAFATTADVDADGTMVWNGTIEINWYYRKGVFV